MSALVRDVATVRRRQELKALSAEFETAAPEAVLQWAINEFGSKIALATGFGP
jgi:hypothetical protein